MKKLLLYALLAGLPVLAGAQSKYITQFYNHYKAQEEVTNLNLQGFVLSLASTFADDSDARKILRKVSHLRLLMMENENLVSPEAYTSLIRGIKSDRFEELMMLREENQRIEFFLREDGDTITDVLMLLHGDGEFLMLSLEGAFKFSDLNDLKIDLDGGEHFSKIPDRKPKA